MFAASWTKNTDVQAGFAYLMVWFLLCAGALYLIVHDQRYRCRTCLRRLRMPIGTGSWGQMLQLGRPPHAPGRSTQNGGGGVHGGGTQPGPHAALR